MAVTVYYIHIQSLITPSPSQEHTHELLEGYEYVPSFVHKPFSLMSESRKWSLHVSNGE